jgi:imidazolonepropionase-like amidohydrolase
MPGSRSSPALTPGGHGHPANAGELVCLARSGVTPMQAIQAGTSWAAECIGWKDRIGTIEKGKLANLIVVDGDPLAEMKVLTEPARLAHQGWCDRRQPDEARSITPEREAAWNN